MTSPPYHLRPNKAIDRFRLLEILKALKVGGYPLFEYKYIGFGGPFLEDLRLIGNFFPEMETVSIEKDVDVYNRQQFHIPHKKVNLINKTSKEFINDYASETKCVFWLDYTDLKPSHFDEFKELIEKVQQNSIVKITLRAELSSYPPEKIRTHVSAVVQAEAEASFVQRFYSQYGNLVPANLEYSAFRSGRFYSIVEQMLHIATQQVWPAAAGGLVFKLLDSTYYSDSAHMYCLTGMICSREDAINIHRLLAGSKFTNLTWGNPKKIDVPILSTKERFYLEQHLPLESNTGESLHNELDYNIIADSEVESIEKLQQYADFAEYLPYFVKAVP